jgi:6-phosphogluconolactonase
LKPSSKYKLKVFPGAEALHKGAAEFIIEVANKAIAARERFTISLSGGQTPQKLYSLLAGPPYKDKIDWTKTFVFWGDERCVPLNDARNNAFQAKSMLLDKIDIPQGNIHRIPVNLPPAEAAAKYEKELKDFFSNKSPRFDLMLLGLGENGHTASLFPATNVLDEQAAGVREVYVEEGKVFRITMTASLINQAHHILFLVEGNNKADILEKVLTGHYQQQNYPAQLIKPAHGDLSYFADSAAASLVKH